MILAGRILVGLGFLIFHDIPLYFFHFVKSADMEFWLRMHGPMIDLGL